MIEEEKAEFIEWTAMVMRRLINNPDDLSVELTEGKGAYSLTVYCKENDIGQLIGRQGKLKQALRTIFWSGSRGRKISIAFLGI